MMRKNQCLRYFITVIVSCIFLCGTMTGCGVRDSAIVIPIEEIGTNANEGDSDSAYFGMEYSEDATTEEPSVDEGRSFIYVYVCGAVTNPGVVEIPEGSRADDALQAAGGFAENAQRDYVNLAAKVMDGEKLYFPTIEEAEELEYAEEAEQKGLVNINTADVSRLMTLPGIGEARAQDIVAYREEHGVFQEKEDLKNVSGIKENMYKKLCDKIIVR